MKRVAISIMAVAAVGAAATAQVALPFEVSAPQWSKAAVAGEAGATMYQKAAAGSPTLVHDFFNADEYEPTTFLPAWSNTVSRAHAEACPLKGAAPVLSQTAAWVQVDYVPEIGRQGYSYKVWVPAKSVTVTDMQPLADGVADLKLFADGELAGYGVYRRVSGEDSTLFLGRVSGGKLVCPYILASDAAPADMTADDVKALLATAEAVPAGEAMVVCSLADGSVMSLWYVR